MRLAVLVVLAVTAAFVVSACGSSGDSSTSSSSSTAASPTAAAAAPLADAKAILAKATADVTAFTGPTTPTKNTPGKHIVAVDTSSAAEGIKIFHRGFDPAAKALGWKVTTVDGKGTPQGYAAGIQQAITQKADGVVLVAITTSLVANQLKQLKAAHIPVIAYSNVETPHDGLWVANIGYDPPTESKDLAAFVATDSGGKANIAILNDPEFGVVADRAKAFKAELPKLCPDCKISNETDFQVTELGTALGPKVKAVLQANPDVNYIWAAYDASVPPMLTAVGQAGLKGKVKIVSYGGFDQGLQYLRDKNVLAATVGNATEWQGYEAADTMQRTLNGEPPDPKGTHSDPIKLLTWDNVPDKPFAGDVDYAAEYKKLWGVG
jgi:ribose transport system substrate-binding protein